MKAYQKEASAHIPNIPRIFRILRIFRIFWNFLEFLKNKNFPRNRCLKRWHNPSREMAHTSSIYDSIRELDEERRVNREAAPEMSIVNYMVPPPFWELGGSLEMEEIRDEPIGATKVANSSNRIRVKNIYTNVSFEFDKMINAARFVGTTGANMRCGIAYEIARTYRIGGEEYVFEYDGKERPTKGFSTEPSLNGLVEVVSSTGERTPFFSYLSVAKHLGLLVGHVMEEEKRAKKVEMAKNYMVGKEMFTLEFGGEEREKYFGRGIICHWKGIYDREGDWGKIHRINVTR